MPTPQNGLTHSSNSSAVADDFFECVWLFCGVSTEKVNLSFYNKCTRTAWQGNIEIVHNNSTAECLMVISVQNQPHNVVWHTDSVQS